MTDEDQARSVVMVVPIPERDTAVLVDRVAQALRNMRLMEREACAKIADAKYNIDQTAVCSAIASEIRNRR